MRKILGLAMTVVLTLSLLAVPALADNTASITVEASKTTLAVGDTVSYTIQVASGGEGITGLSFDLGLTGLSVTSYTVNCTDIFPTVSGSDIDPDSVLFPALIEGTDGEYGFYATGSSTSGASQDSWKVLTVTCTATAAVSDASKALLLSDILMYRTETIQSDGKTSANEVSVQAAVTYTAVSDATHTPGDINGDGKVTVSDVARLATYINARGVGVEVVEGSADVNGDGKVTVSDVSRLATYVNARGVGVTIY